MIARGPDPARLAAARELTRLIRQARIPRLRTMREFAEQEIVIPEGQYKGTRFNVKRQPYTRLWFGAVDSGRWRRIYSLGPTQSGKSLLAFCIPCMYYLFEMGETVIAGVPNFDIVRDKWEEDLLPAIAASKYRDLLPRSGGGSRGGLGKRVRFRNGATLRFMTGGGGDKARAHFTSRVLVITETDGFAESGLTSVEASKLKQLEARTRAYGKRARIYAECTVTTEEMPTWSNYQAGTASKIHMPCPHCDSCIHLTREDLQGWEDAPTVIDAEESGAFVCPACGEVWSEDHRIEAARCSVLVHDGQSIDDKGHVTGEPRKTDTLGFRWSAADNLFVTAGEVAADQWRAARAKDEDNAEREICQYVWALPHEPPKIELTSVSIEGIIARVTDTPRGAVPSDTKFLTVGLDLGKHVCHWIAIAWGEQATSQIVDYGVFHPPVDDLGVESALDATLQEFRDTCKAGWSLASNRNRTMRPSIVLVDAGWQTEIVYRVAVDEGPWFRPAMGFGSGQLKPTYTRPTSKGARVRRIGRGYHVATIRDPVVGRVALVEIDADHWKTFLHDRLSSPIGKPGAMQLFLATPREHIALARQLTAERPEEVFRPGQQPKRIWKRVYYRNHWLDAAYMACVAGHLAGVRVLAEPESVRAKQEPGMGWFEQIKRQRGAWRR